MHGSQTKKDIADMLGCPLKKYIYFVYAPEGVYYDGKQNRWMKPKIYFYYYKNAKKFSERTNRKLYKIEIKDVDDDACINI